MNLYSLEDLIFYFIFCSAFIWIIKHQIHIWLPRKVKNNCRATIGQVGNLEHEQINIGKAGKNRLRGRRPKVRGVVMNPVDHPHGGGEGRTSGGRHPVSPWGLPTKGFKTRKNKRTDRFIAKRRKSKNKK